MLLRMKSSRLVACLLLGSASCCVGQETCSKPVESERAATVAALRKQLRAVKVAEDTDTDVPPVAQGLIPQLQSALAQTARPVLACQDATVDPHGLEGE